jgi:hypothetical protein
MGETLHHGQAEQFPFGGEHVSLIGKPSTWKVDLNSGG